MEDSEERERNILSDYRPPVIISLNRDFTTGGVGP